MTHEIRDNMGSVKQKVQNAMWSVTPKVRDDMGCVNTKSEKPYRSVLQEVKGTRQSFMGKVSDATGGDTQSQR